MNRFIACSGFLDGTIVFIACPSRFSRERPSAGAAVVIVPGSAGNVTRNDKSRPLLMIDRPGDSWPALSCLSDAPIRMADEFGRCVICERKWFTVDECLWPFMGTGVLILIA
jgi:hypothetical protein